MSRVQSGVTRRQLVASAAASGGALLGAGAVSAHELGPGAEQEALSEPWVVGIVQRVDPDGTLYLRPPDSQRTIRVDIGPETVVLGYGPVSPTSFDVGDQVSAQGEESPRGVVKAARVEAVFEVAHVDITQRQGNRLRTTGGDVVLTSRTRARGGRALGHDLDARPLARLGKGDTVVVEAIRDGNTGDLVAASVGAVIR